MKIKKIVLTLAFLSVFINLRAEFKVVAYLPNWFWTLEKHKNAFDFSKVTHLNIAFFNPDIDGNFPVEQQGRGLDTIVAKAHLHHVKVLLSLAGGTDEGQYAKLLKKENRTAFIEKIMALVSKYNVDGIDVDLEGKNIDENYEAFVTELSSQLKPKGKLLSAAVGWWTRSKITDECLKAFDFINIMSYATPASPHTSLAFVEQHINYWKKERKIPASKLIVGMAFYGRYDLNEKEFKKIDYSKLLTKYPGAAYKDSIVRSEDGLLIRYNGIPLTKLKTNYALKEAGGIMIWQILQDSQGPLSLLNTIDEQIQESKSVKKTLPKLATPIADFQVKGFHLDLRIQAMQMPALKEFALKLSKNGINTLIMEWEATYPYEKHNVITGRYAYSRADVKSFVAYCKTLKIDVIPLQQSFGHVEYILRNHRYKELREDQKDYSQVNPIKEDLCKALFTDLYKDLISTHDSPYIHIGGDETYLLGRGEESKKKVAAVGMGRLYGDYIKMLCDVVVSLGRKPIVWADIALHYPDALRGLPKETIFVDWNYGWPLDRFGDHQQLMKSGFEIWGSPAIRSAQDNYFLTDWKKHFDNIRTFIPQAKDLGYKGIVMTSWSTSGLYSNVLESSTEMVDLVAIRRVYPISGFNMLIAAYFKSILNAQPLAIEDFVHNYAKESYGFDEKQSSQFWNAITRAPFEVNQGKVSKPGVSIVALLDSAKLTVANLKSLRPQKSQTEFEHYLLMSDIRVFYLQCMLVEDEMNLVSFGFNDVARLLKKLNKLKPEELNTRFKELNKNLMFATEIDVENTLRNERLKFLKAKLANQK